MSFLEGCFRVDPEKRLTIFEILRHLTAIAESTGYNLKAPISVKTMESTRPQNDLGQGDANNMGAPKQPPSRPPMPTQPPKPVPPVIIHVNIKQINR